MFTYEQLDLMFQCVDRRIDSYTGENYDTLAKLIALREAVWCEIQNPCRCRGDIDVAHLDKWIRADDITGVADAAVPYIVHGSPRLITVDGERVS